MITIAKETGQAADSLVGDNVLKMRARCWRYGRAVWILNIDLFPFVLQASIAVGTAGGHLPVWQPGDAETGTPDRILGRPAYFHDVASAIGDVGDIMLVNWSEYLDATYVDLRSDNSMHVRFAAVERAFRFYQRGDGQAAWRSPLTPKRSATTLSPFITLAAR